MKELNLVYNKTRAQMIRKVIKIILIAIIVFFVLFIISGFVSIQTYSSKMKKMTLEERLQYTLIQITDGKKIHGAVFNVYDGSSGFEWSGASGNLSINSQYSIASITKMYTSTVIMKLVEEKQIGLDDPVSKYLSSEMTNGLHVYRGKDYSQDITIRYLLGHRSGLPDYFTESTLGKTSISEERKANHDFSYNFNDILNRTKMMPAHFIPGTKGKAYYSDGNYQILGYIIEKVTNKSLGEVYRELIFEPLGLSKTYLQTNPGIWGISSIYNGETEIQVPAMLSSERSAGGIVSTANDNMIFLKAFFSGELFPKTYLEQMEQWNKIFFPMEYGFGIMRCNIPIGSRYEVIGHSGSTGTLSYYCPSRDIFITGSTQQLDTTKAMEVIYRLLLCFNF